MILSRLDFNGIVLNLKKHLFFEYNLLFDDQWIFSKEVINPHRSKLVETEKMHTPKSAKKLRSFLGFSNFVKRSILNSSTLKYTHTSFKRTPRKGSWYSLDWNL